MTVHYSVSDKLRPFARIGRYAAVVLSKYDGPTVTHHRTMKAACRSLGRIGFGRHRPHVDYAGIVGPEGFVNSLAAARRLIRGE